MLYTVRRVSVQAFRSVATRFVAAFRGRCRDYTLATGRTARIRDTDRSSTDTVHSVNYLPRQRIDLDSRKTGGETRLRYGVRQCIDTSANSLSDFPE